MVYSLKRRCLAELFGTFCLVFAGTGAVILDQTTHGKVGVVGIGIVFGLIVFAMISLLGKISGAHLNPAVTIGFFIARRHPVSEVGAYIVAQIGGAIMASFLLRAIFLGSTTNLGMTLPAGSSVQSFGFEFFLTLILMVVILSVSTEDQEEGVLAAIAIGGTVAFEAIFAGPISGASMNPARSLGPAIAAGHLTHLWIYWVAPILGSMAGVFIDRLFAPYDGSSETKPSDSIGKS